MTVLPASPEDDEKTSYAWRSLPFLGCALALSALCVIVAQGWLEVRYLIALPFAVYTLLYLLYQAVSLPTNFTGHSFDMRAHRRRVAAWRPARYPSVDVFLPICGEDLAVLRNTWAGVLELAAAYRGELSIYVLDDGPSDEARELARWMGVHYIRRKNVRFHKKSGNLNHAFRLTSGEFVVIFDADFRPRTDFLAELLPYMDDQSLGIVQSPQYFRVEKGQSWLERAAGATLEVFYRSVQQSRDRFGSALCVGSNAVYRRAALERNGGFTVIPYAEDSHTGLDLRMYGWQLKYIPVVLAAGVCPSTVDTFMRQQYRWCNGATSLLFTKRVWKVPMPWKSRLPYVAGWLWNLTAAMRTVFLPLIPITLLLFLPDEIQLRNAVLLIPAIITGTVLYPLWHNAKWPLGTWPLAIAVGWAQAIALWDYCRHKTMSWESTRGPGDTPRRFKRAVIGWNGTLALAWFGLAAWRLYQTGSDRFAFVALFGLVNVIVVVRIMIPGKEQSAPRHLAVPAGGRGGRERALPVQAPGRP